MVKLRSRLNAPVNGWWFTDPAIDSKAFSAHDFNSLVMEVINRRKNNPRFNLSTDIATVQNEVDTQNALRMLSIRGADSYVTQTGGGPDPNLQARRSGGRAVAGSISNVAAGAATLADWLGEGGKPVSPQQSSLRASICAVCPQNGKGDWTKYFTEPAAAYIRRQLALKNQYNYTTPSDEQLGVCEACTCPLKLKVHTPINHIAKNMDEETRAKLDATCWVLQETK